MRRRTALLGLVFAIAALSSSALGQERPGATRVFRDWVAACDNGGECVALSGAGDAAAVWIVVRVGASFAEPSATVFADPSVAEGGSQAIARLGEVSIELTRAGGGWQVPAARTRAFLNELARGRELVVVVGETAWALSLSGISAALLWIDDRQGRLGSAHALLRPGSSVPAARQPAELPPAPRASPASQQGLADRALPRALTSTTEVASCVAELPRARHRVYRLGAGVLLWEVPCWRGAYNVYARYWTTDEAGQGPMRQSFPIAFRGRQTELVNSEFDGSTGELSEVHLLRGVGDCGYARRWLWTGSTFVLVAEREMPECLGVPMSHWPLIYRTDPGR